MRILLIVLALPLAAPLGAQTRTYNVEDYLPLAVGNSWTYEHEYWDERRNADGTKVPEPTFSTTEFTISILRTEVINGETYYVFSDLPDNWPAEVPGHFIAGKKLRWDGNNLTEHDGTSSFSIYRFDIPTDELDPITGEYSIPTTHGDNLVETYSQLMGSGMMYQRFKFKGYTGYTSDGNWDAPESALGWSFSRNISFAEKFGVILALEVIREDDMIVFDTRLKPVRALLHTTGEQSQGGGTRSVEESTGVTIEWDDFNCAFSGQGRQYGKTCNYPPTSTSSASWGQVKESRNSR